MKLQGVSVIFALIVLPLILVLTYYIQLQVDTIEKQSEYDKKLLDSTYGAMSAFEINTANEDLSSVSDSLRTIIDASTNIFMNTLATNLGMSNASKSYLEPYIPALLYTLYDGYYISAPTRTPMVLTDSDGNAVYVGNIGVKAEAGKYTFENVHTSSESQKNCTECVTTYDSNGKITGATQAPNHILYEKEAGNTDTNVYSKMTLEEQGKLYATYSEVEAIGDAGSYGQLLYIKKKTDPLAPDEYTTNVDEAEVEIKHILKTYMPYSAKYKRGDEFDFVAIYTLDNYLSIEGTINDVYYTRSGYFIPSGSVSIEPTNLSKYNQNDAKKFIEDGNLVKITLSDGTELSSGGNGKNKVQLDEGIRVLNTIYDKITSYIAQLSKMTPTAEEEANIETYLSYLTVLDENTLKSIPVFDTAICTDSTKTLEERLKLVKEEVTLRINDYQYQLDEISSVSYYVTASIFSDWIYANLVNKNAVIEKDLVEISGQNYNLVKGKSQVSHDFSESDSLVFNIVGTGDNKFSKLNSVMEIDKDSSFYSHKVNIIRDSIQYNLNLAMSTYNKMLISTKDYAMPVMQNEEWEKILSNVSIVAFMQGYDCGLKTYSNYKIVSSTNNEISILPEEIYYVKKEDFSNENEEYHRIDCPKLFTIDTGTTNKYRSFTSKEVKYDKLYDKTNALIPYEYNHKNLACYECVNDGNYIGISLFDSSDVTNYPNYANLRKSYYIGVGKSRNNLYKMNAIENSEGYEVIYDKAAGISLASSKFGYERIKSIEIVLDTIKTRDAEENVLNYTVGSSKKGMLLNSTIYTIVPNVTTRSTIKVNVDPTQEYSDSDTGISVSDLVFDNLFDESTAYIDTNDAASDTEIVRNSILFVKVIYR